MPCSFVYIHDVVHNFVYCSVVYIAVTICGLKLLFVNGMRGNFSMVTNVTDY